MATKIAYAIARESSGDKTLANQFADIRKAAKELGYEIVQEFGENISGNIAKYDYANPQFIDDLDVAIKKRKPDAIFCVSMDRVTRTPVMQGKYLMDFSVIPLIPIYFTRFKRWTIDPITQIVDKDWIDDLATEKGGKTERLNIVARTSPQREKIGAEGYFIGHLSDGYCVEESWGIYDDGQRRKIKKIIIDDDRKKVIEDIFKWYRNGYSIAKIVDTLNSTNVPTTNAYRASSPTKFGYRKKYKGKDGILKERKDARWNGSIVSQILSNPWYKGERSYRGNILQHDAIIPKEEWEEAKAIREENKISFRTKKEATKHIYPLSDLFFCGQCGRKMYGHYTGLNNHYYCSSIETMNKCGLTGISKENVDAIVYDIISNKAVKAVVEGTEDFTITDFFKLDKAKEENYRDQIINNNKIIAKSEAEIIKQKKIIENAVHYQLTADDPFMREMYAKEINRAKSSIEEEEKKIVNNKIENKRINQLLSSNSNIKEVLKNIINDKDLSVIKNLFKHVIDKVVIFNADKRDDVVRVRFKNGIESEFIYCARLLGNKYILLEKPLRYDEDLRTIVSEVVPTYIIIDNDEFVFYRRTESNLESEKRLFPTLTIHNTQTYAITNGLTVKEFVKIVRDTNIAIPFERLEEETELAKTQKAHYQQWRKKYNTGKPSGVTYILHNETYEEIQTLRNRLYRKTYKIKQRKNLSDEEKETKIAEIKRQLDALNVQVPLIRPRKKRTPKEFDKDELVRAFEEPTKDD